MITQPYGQPGHDSTTVASHAHLAECPLAYCTKECEMKQIRFAIEVDLCRTTIPHGLRPALVVKRKLWEEEEAEGGGEERRKMRKGRPW
jgi:hypothetical protein